MYDVIVVGARCAGSPTAMLLARRGFKVLLVDKTMADYHDLVESGRREIYRVESQDQ